jgi:hypothetical protein
MKKLLKLLASANLIVRIHVQRFRFRWSGECLARRDSGVSTRKVKVS